MATQHAPIGTLIRDWRQRRRLSQLDLACEADISTRHLSFMENGRARPSREMLLHLAERLSVPLRERNALLVAAGYAPAYAEHALDAPELAAARQAVQRVIDSHAPFPALAVDRHWQLLMANVPAQRFLAGVAPHLLEGRPNVLRISLHPDGLAPRIANLAEWRAHLLERLQRQVAQTGDSVLAELHRELSAYPAPDDHASDGGTPWNGVVVPLRYRSPAGELTLFSTITVFGTPVDITLSELALEAFYPADAHTADVLRAMDAG